MKRGIDWEQSDRTNDSVWGQGNGDEKADFTHKTTTKSVLDLVNLYKNDNLNLEPGFQRQSVLEKESETAQN